jgi:hypothetical protein
MSEMELSMDQRKLLAEIDEMNASTRKLLIEANKLHIDTRFVPWQVAFAGFTAGALVIGAIITAMKVLGV